jgi:hypothetical protein
MSFSKDLIRSQLPIKSEAIALSATKFYRYCQDGTIALAGTFAQK